MKRQRPHNISLRGKLTRSKAVVSGRPNCQQKNQEIKAFFCPVPNFFPVNGKHSDTIVAGTYGKEKGTEIGIIIRF